MWNMDWTVYSFTGLIPRYLQRSEGRSQGRIPRSLLRGGSFFHDYLVVGGGAYTI